MGQLGLAAAFLGGALTLISPCSALLLPSFFAYAFARPRDILARTAVFWIGLSTTLVPLGMGSALVSRVFYGHRETLITGAGWLIIAMGIVQLLGGGFAIPGADRLRAQIAGRGRGRDRGRGRGRGWSGTLLLGAVYGLAGFCSGPVLGSVLTIAAAQGDLLGGGVLLAVYALGMTAPMFVLALAWKRFDLGGRRWLRGRPVRVGPVRVHSTQLVSGVLFVVIGWLFLRFDGTAGITGALGLGDPTGVDMGVQQWLTGMSPTVLDLGVLGVVAAVLLAVIARRLLRPGTCGSGVAADTHHHGGGGGAAVRNERDVP